jgi:hypothetical protein
LFGDPIYLPDHSYLFLFIFTLPSFVLGLVFNVLLLLSHRRTYHNKFIMPAEVISEPNPQALERQLGT